MLHYYFFQNCYSFFFYPLRWTLGLVLSQNDMLAESGRRNFTQKCGSGLTLSAAKRWGGGGPDIKARRWEFRWRIYQVLSSLIRGKMITPEVHYGQEVLYTLGLWSCGIFFQLPYWTPACEGKRGFPIHGSLQHAFCLRVRTFEGALFSSPHQEIICYFDGLLNLEESDKVYWTGYNLEPVKFRSYII